MIIPCILDGFGVIVTTAQANVIWVIVLEELLKSPQSYRQQQETRQSTTNERVHYDTDTSYQGSRFPKVVDIIVIINSRITRN